MAVIRALAATLLGRAKRLVRASDAPKENVRLAELMEPSPVWCTREFASLLGAKADTADWGHHWVIRRLAGESLLDKILVDLGSGVRSPVSEYYADKVRHAYLVDLLNPAELLARATVLKSTLEAPLPLPDGSVDVVVSNSVLEHLSAAGRLLQASEIDRVLRPGGKAFFTMSYLFDLNGHAIDVLSRDPWLNSHGNTITSRLDVAAMLARMPGLRLLGTADLSMFPGFDRFDEARVRAIPKLLTHTIADCEWATFAPETNALGIEWAEIGIAMEKPAVGDVDAAGSTRRRRTQ